MVHVAKLLGSDQRLRPDLPESHRLADVAPRTRDETCGDSPAEGRDRWPRAGSRSAASRRKRHHSGPAPLRDRHSADSLQARCAIVQQACEQHADHPRRAVHRGRTEERIDRRPRPVFLRPAADMDVVVTNDQMTVGWCDVNMGGCEACPSSAVRTGRREVLPRTRASRPGSWSAVCSTTKSEAGRSAGRRPSSRRSASTPPIEAPMTTTSRFGGSSSDC